MSKKVPGVPPSRVRKQAVNLSVRADLLRNARALHLNVSELLEEALEAAVGDLRRGQWQEENDAAITAYNQQVESRGVFSDGWRRF